jgi:hypothetical protein
VRQGVDVDADVVARLGGLRLLLGLLDLDPARGLVIGPALQLAKVGFEVEACCLG